MDNHGSGDISNCPFMGGAQSQTAGSGTANRDWWPNQLNLNLLRQNSEKSDPMGKSFDYAKEFESLDLAAIKSDMTKISRVAMKSIYPTVLCILKENI